MKEQFIDICYECSPIWTLDFYEFLEMTDKWIRTESLSRCQCGRMRERVFFKSLSPNDHKFFDKQYKHGEYANVKNL